MKQYERKVDVTTISLDGIDTTGAWSVESEESVMEVALDSLKVDHDTDSDHGDDTKSLDEDVLAIEEFYNESGSVPRSKLEGDRLGGNTGTGRGVGVRLPQPSFSSFSGHHFARTSSRKRQSAVRGPQASRAPISSSRGKVISTMITFSRKRGRGNR